MKRRRRTGSHLGRTEIASVRLTPRSHFGGELAAYMTRRTLSSLMEVAAAAYLEQVEVLPGLTASQLMDEVWHPDPAEKFVRMAQRYPTLLSHDQLLLWEKVQRTPELWLSACICPCTCGHQRQPDLDKIRELIERSR